MDDRHDAHLVRAKGGLLMSTIVVAISGIANLLDFRTPLLWFVLACGLLSVGGLIWMALCSIRRRYTGHATRCPLDGREVHVFVARDAAGHANDVVRCSKMSPPHRVTCGKTCLALIGDA